jgi:hypothetical protein
MALKRRLGPEKIAISLYRLMGAAPPRQIAYVALGDLR